MKVSNEVSFTKIRVTMAILRRHTTFYGRPNNLPSRVNFGNNTSWSMNWQANYVQKTWLNDILVINRFYSIELTQVKISEKSLHLTFRNVGLNIICYAVLLWFFQLFHPQLLNWAGNNLHLGLRSNIFLFKNAYERGERVSTEKYIQNSFFSIFSIPPD